MASITSNKKLKTEGPILTAQPARGWKMFLVFIIEKIGENVLDMVVTVLTLGIMLAYLLITVPEIAVAYSGYIIAIYMLILLIRIVHDFDDDYTNQELGARLDLILDFQKEMWRRQRDESELSDTDLEERLNALM